MTREVRIEQIMQSNPQIFGLHFEDYRDGAVVYSKPSQTSVNKATEDLEVFERRERRLLEAHKPVVGDFIKLPYGIYMRVGIHLYDNEFQMCSGGSFYLGKSGCSMSGSLDDRFDSGFLSKTEEVREGRVWIFSGDSPGGGRGVHTSIDFKVWEFNTLFDIESLSVMRRHRINEYASTCETITRIDGNGFDYTLPVPVVKMRDAEAIAKIPFIEEKLRIKFGENVRAAHHFQPSTIKQVDEIITISGLAYERYSNASEPNTLFLFDSRSRAEKKSGALIIQKDWKT